MQGQHGLEILLTTLIINSIIQLTWADFEYICTASKYTEYEDSNPGMLDVCVVRSAKFIEHQCSLQDMEPSLTKSTGLRQRDTSLFVDPTLASMVLRTQQQADSYVGLDCECCIHRCTSTEFAQYCIADTPRRRRRDVTNKRSATAAAFNEEAVEKLYSEIDAAAEQQRNLVSREEMPKFSLDHLEFIRRSKIKNIRARLLSSLFGANPAGEQRPSSTRSKQLDNTGGSDGDKTSYDGIMRSNSAEQVVNTRKLTSVTNPQVNTFHTRRPNTQSDHNKLIT